MSSMWPGQPWPAGWPTSSRCRTRVAPVGWPACSVPPTARPASPRVENPGARNVTYDQLVNAYLEATRGLIDGGADLLLVETIFDSLNARAALFAIEQYFEETGTRYPVMISGTITDASGRTLSGQTAEAFWYSMSNVRPLSIGLNCALGADQLRQYVQELARIADCYVSAHPNAGLPTPSAATMNAGAWPSRSANGRAAVW